MALQTTHKDVSFRVGDTIRVYYRIIEREKKAGKTKKSVKEEIKERLQPYEGIVISIKGSSENKSFTVRRMGADQIGIERVFPLSSPWIDRIMVKREGKVRRSKLYYLRNAINMNVKKKEIEIKKTSSRKSKKASEKPSEKEAPSVKKVTKTATKKKA